MIDEIPRFARTPLVIKRALMQLYAAALDKLIDSGVTTKRIRHRTLIMSQIEQATGTPRYGSEEDYLIGFVGAQQPRARTKKPKPVPEVRVAPVAAPIYAAPKGAYVLPRSMQIAQARAQKEQCKLITLTGKTGFVNLGSRD